MCLFIQTFNSDFSVTVELRFTDHLYGLLILTSNSKHKRYSKVHGRRWSLPARANVLIPSCQYFHNPGSASFEHGTISSNGACSCCSFDTAPTVSSLLRWERAGSYLGFSQGLGSTVWISLVDDVRLRLRCGSLMRLGRWGRQTRLSAWTVKFSALLSCIAWNSLSSSGAWWPWSEALRCAELCLEVCLHGRDSTCWPCHLEATVITENITLAYQTGAAPLFNTVLSR